MGLVMQTLVGCVGMNRGNIGLIYTAQRFNNGYHWSCIVGCTGRIGNNCFCAIKYGIINSQYNGFDRIIFWRDAQYNFSSSVFYMKLKLFGGFELPCRFNNKIYVIGPPIQIFGMFAIQKGDIAIINNNMIVTKRNRFIKNTMNTVVFQ